MLLHITVCGHLILDSFPWVYIQYIHEIRVLQGLLYSLVGLLTFSLCKISFPRMADLQARISIIFAEGFPQNWDYGPCEKGLYYSE